MKWGFYGKNCNFNVNLKSPIFERKVHLPSNGGRRLRAPVRLVLVKKGQVASASSPISLSSTVNPS